MWWKTFADPYEPYLLFRKNSMGGLWTAGYLLALFALVGIFGVDMLPQLAIPVALGGLYVLLSYVTGVVGMVIFAPIMSYAWMCLDHMIVYGLYATNQAAAFEGLVCAMVMVVLLIGAPHVRAQLLVLVILEGVFYGALAPSSYYLMAFELPNDEGAMRAGQLLDKVIVGSFWGMVAVAAIVLVIVLVALVRSKSDRTEVARHLRGNLLLFAAGFVPPVVGSLLSRANPVLAMLAMLLIYAVVAFFARLKGVERVCWALVPLAVLGTLAVIAQAPLDLLPAWKPGAALIRTMHDGPICKVSATLTMPLLEGTNQMLGPTLRQMLQGRIDAVPENALILCLLGLYALYFFASVIMGTIVGVADLKAYAAGRKKTTAAEDGADALAQSDGPLDDATATAFAEGAVAREPQLLPSWIAGGPLRKMLKRRGGEEPTETSSDAYVLVEKKDGTIGRRFGTPKGLLSRELRLALGLPVVEKLGKRRRYNWDEQLSGTVPCFEGAHISQAAIRYLTDRIKRPIRKGLWWKVFEDDGRTEFIPKGSAMDVLLVWLPLMVVLRIVSVDWHANLVTPIMLVLCVMSACHVLGILGNIATGPMLLYGWSALMWLVSQYNVRQMGDSALTIDPITLFAILTVVTTFTRAFRRDMGWTTSMVFYGAGAAWFCGQQYAIGSMNEQTVRAIMGYVYLASMVIAAVFTLRLLYKEAMLLKRWPEALPDELKCVILSLAGVLPLMAASALSAAGPLMAILGATVAYVALAVIGRLRSPKGLSCLLLPLLAGAAVWSLTAVDATTLPPSTMTDRLVALCGSGPLAFLAHGAQPVMEGSAKLLEMPVRAALLFVLNLANDNPIPADAISPELVQVFCLFAGILVIASIMGIGISLLEGARPQLVESVLEREQRVLEVLTERVAAEKAPIEEVSAEESTSEETFSGEVPAASEGMPTDESADKPVAEKPQREDGAL